MLRFARFLAASLALALILAPQSARASAANGRPAAQEPPQETGFLNRKIELHGATYRFQVYLPEEWRRDDRKLWPIILFLHGRGERGSEGMWQTQIGLPQEVRDHPERWPFVIVMPQCPLPNYWTDAEMLAMAMAALDKESAEFHGDPERTYLSGLSLGGYGAWELARLHPHRWAAIAIAASGAFWSYAPERWQEVSTLPAEYAHALGRTPVWLFHGLDDNVVPPRESELMFEALKAADGHVRLWLYQGLTHDCWTRAYNEAELPRWLPDRRRQPLPSVSSFHSIRLPSNWPLPSLKTWPGNTSIEMATLGLPSSARVTSFTRKTGWARLTSWPRNPRRRSSIQTALASPGSPSSSIRMAAPLLSSCTTTATMSVGKSDCRH